MQDLGNLLSWNRYAYVLNNPLSLTDPSGFFFKKLFKAIGKFFSSIAKQIVPILKAVLQLAACAALPGVGCAIVSGIMTLASGGSIFDAVKSMVFAFVSMGVWTGVGDFLVGAPQILRMGVHGIVNGALSVMQGGSFLQGFASGVIGEVGSMLGAGFGSGSEGRLASTLVAAAAGCAGAAVAGGKCAQGAVTAGFAHLYNYLAHKDKLRPLESAGGYVGGGGGASGSLPPLGAAIWGSASTTVSDTYDWVAKVFGDATSPSQSGTQVHGNSLSSGRPTHVYQIVGPDRLEPGNAVGVLKYGITSRYLPEDRYSQIYIKNVGEIQHLGTYRDRQTARYIEFGYCMSFVAVRGRVPTESRRC